MAKQSSLSEDFKTKEVCITGILEKRIYVSESKKYYIFALRDNTGETKIVKGFISDSVVDEGDEVEVYGTLMYDEYGESIEATKIVPMDTYVQGMYRYLIACVPGIGEKTAESLIKKYGDNLLKIINENPEQLKDVLTDKQLKEVVSTLKEQTDIIKDLVITFDITPNLAQKIYSVYGDEALSLLKENPYRLWHDIDGISFTRADEIAMNLNIPKSSKNRIVAWAEYKLKRYGNERGWSYIEKDYLCEKGSEKLELPSSYVEGTILGEAGRFIYDKGLIYLKWVYDLERELAERIIEIQTSTCYDDIDEQEMQVLEKKHSVELSKMQRVAVSNIIRSSFTIVSGNAGVGKTTLMRLVVGYFKEKAKTIKIASPTGRGAKVIEKATGHEAKTIHKLLDYSPKDGFRKNENNPIDADIIIVDEFSMVNLWLAVHLFKAIKRGTKLIIVGDAEQLPAIGVGNCLREMIYSYSINHIKLMDIFRQSEGSNIYKNAGYILGGKIPSCKTQGTDYIFKSASDEQECVEETINIIKQMSKPDLKTFKESGIILTPIRSRGVLCVNTLNTRLKSILNPDKGQPVLNAGVKQFQKGDKVMVQRNNYDKGIYNGDVGIVNTVEPKSMTVQFIDYTGDTPQNRDVGFTAKDANKELILAYASTVHKSQGGEYDIVVVSVMMRGGGLFVNKQLLYTAFSRAKKVLYVVSNNKVLWKAVKVGNTWRKSTLAQRIKEARKKILQGS